MRTLRNHVTAPRLVALAAASLVLSVVIVRAAGLSTTSDGVGAAAVSLPRCTTVGQSVVETITSTNITGVTVSGISATCAGGTLAATVNVGGGSTGSGTVTVPAGGGTASVTISPAVAFVGNAEIDTEITGP